MTSYKQLNKTPIKEIIFSISYSEDIDPMILQKFCELPELASGFSRHEGFHANIQAKSDQKPVSKIINDGFVLRSENYIIQARMGSFAFHKVKEYESFTSLFDKLGDFWNKLIGFTGDLTIKKISLRYLNFIELEEGETIEQLINIVVQHPFKYQLKNQLVQLNFISNENPSLKINLVIAKGQDENKNGIVLDTILNLDIDNSTDYKSVLNNFHFMREAKNEIFFTSLTDYAKKKYNGN